MTVDEAETTRKLVGTAAAFMWYFNPMELPSDKEDQWWALYDALNDFANCDGKDQ